ncbi:hypothetical protein MNAN1_001095 [Malassezia nana]|uniref:50S ribosomal protein L35 n=1 Tax=Malassezia nana TaxID=180528 RepID=A0AAF0EKA4_9BASI|nr:hypothetical protein MNAN1_001095 [Malassezia nana]
MLGLGAGRPSLVVARMALQRPLHMTAFLNVAPRPSSPKTKLKTHMGTKKRFFPVQGSALPKFKRASPNKQHLNSAMSRVRLARLRGTHVVGTGPVSKMLRRLLAPRL